LRILLNSLVLVFFLFSSKINAQQQKLTGIKWYLISIDRLETSKSKLIDKRFESTITFNADSTFTGVTCNQYTGSFTTQHHKNIKMNVTSVKKLGCVWLDELEREVLKHFKDVVNYRLKEDLFLFTSDGLRLTFKTHR
jgi:heat shock protein HslJ